MNNRLFVPNEMLCVHAGVDGEHAPGRITDRACCIVTWGAWLPIETDYSRGIGELRRHGREIVQVSHLKSTGNVALLREIMRQVAIKALELKATDIVAAVAPESVACYARLHFTNELFSDWQIALVPDIRGALQTEIPVGRWILARDLNGEGKLRMLHPAERERGLGFPPEWTGGFPRSVRNRMLGNSVNIRATRWLATRIGEAQNGR